MATGFLSAGVCWSSLELAGQAACGVFPVAGTSGSSLIVKYCTAHASAGALTIRGATCTSASCTLDATPRTFTPAYAACEQDITRSAFDLSFADGALIGSAVLAVWGAAWAWRALRQTVTDSPTPDDL